VPAQHRNRKDTKSRSRVSSGFFDSAGGIELCTVAMGLFAAGAFRNSILVLRLSYFLGLFAFPLSVSPHLYFFLLFFKILSQDLPVKVTKGIFRICQ
jgi:hypothetical protein